MGLKLLLDPIIVQETPFRLMVGAVVVSAWYGGLGPGLLATVVGGLITDYFFLPPINSISGLSTESVPLMLFLLEGLLITGIVVGLRHARQRAEASTREGAHFLVRFAYKAKGGEEIPIFLTPTQVAGIIVEPR